MLPQPELQNMTYLTAFFVLTPIALGVSIIATHRRLPRAIDEKVAESVELTQTVLSSLSRDGSPGKDHLGRTDARRDLHQ